MSNYLITGANRGIGLEMTRQALALGHRVVATCRHPDDATELTSLDGEISIHSLDVADAEATMNLADLLEGMTLDVLVNNAGIMAARQSVDNMDYDEWMQSFMVNTMAPWRLSLCFANSLDLSTAPRVVTLTSQMGSLERAGSDRVAYRSSKAAANMAMKTLALEWYDRGIAVCMLHPGWVRTDMGGSDADVGPVDSVAGLLQVIDRLTLDDSGRFLDYQGKTIPW